MKRRLALWAARTTAADRLARGSGIVWRHRADALAAWVRAGRRDDLTGWRAALGPIARLLLLGVLAYVVWAVVRALPWLMWLVTGWWIRAAWKAGKTTPTEATEEATEEAAPVPDRETFRSLLLEVMGDAPAVHLRTVLAHLQERGLAEARTVSELRSVLEAVDIPVHPKVKAPGGGPTRGVRRVDLASSPAAVEETPVSPSTTV
ncbi:hypothetical protein ACFVAF_36935 [Streptomyces sp. NPDC057596]|uniref:hypothetical protein n=1 Tax=Streptomyces sp. NPDC057596 TaxID=3346178 RepID=UPI0036B7EF56